MNAQGHAVTQALTPHVLHHSPSFFFFLLLLLRGCVCLCMSLNLVQYVQQITRTRVLRFGVVKVVHNAEQLFVLFLHRTRRHA